MEEGNLLKLCGIWTVVLSILAIATVSIVIVLRHLEVKIRRRGQDLGDGTHGVIAFDRVEDLEDQVSLSRCLVVLLLLGLLLQRMWARLNIVVGRLTLLLSHGLGYVITEGVGATLAWGCEVVTIWVVLGAEALHGLGLHA